MMTMQIGGTCQRHPLNIIPCQKCIEEAAAAPPSTAAPYGIIDPDYARVYTQTRIIAWQYGYACVMHGSFTRDLDLLLVPWEPRAIPNHEQLLRLIADACNLHLYVEYGKLRMTDKPHGRKAFTLHFPGVADRRWVDVSILPCEAKHPDGTAEYESWQAPAGVKGVRDAEL